MYGIVLAAGSGARMGGPKARLVISGTPLVHAHVTRLRDAGCVGVVVVVRAEDVDVAPPAALTAVSAAPDPAGSLLIGLELVPAEEDVIVITPVDVLPARAATIRALSHALSQENILAATPTCGTRGGHPVIVRREALVPLANGVSLRDALFGLGERRARVETDNPAVVTDLDVPADVLALTRALPTFLP